MSSTARGQAPRPSKVVPGLDHHFVRYANRRDAYRETGGTVTADPVVEAILAWLARIGVRRP
jgi:hypothetical protein